MKMHTPQVTQRADFQSEAKPPTRPGLEPPPSVVTLIGGLAYVFYFDFILCFVFAITLERSRFTGGENTN
jgi:hypothetical protein